MPVLHRPRSWKSLDIWISAVRHDRKSENENDTPAVDDVHPESRLRVSEVIPIVRDLIVALAEQRLVLRQDGIIREERRHHVHKVRPELHLRDAMA